MAKRPTTSPLTYYHRGWSSRQWRIVSSHASLTTTIKEIASEDMAADLAALNALIKKLKKQSMQILAEKKKQLQAVGLYPKKGKFRTKFKAPRIKDGLYKKRNPNEVEKATMEIPNE